MEKDHAYIISNLNSEKTNNAYFNNPLNLHERVTNYVSLLNDFYSKPSKSLLAEIETISFALLPQLNQSVNLFEKESEEKTKDILQREGFILTGTLLTLLLEALFIVIPSIRIANRKEKELTQLNASLEIKINEAIEENRKKEKLLEQQFHLTQMAEMITNIAHQWRQPLSLITSIISGMKLEKDLGITVTNESREEQYNTILEKAQYLSSTIDNFNQFIKKDYNKSEFLLNEGINTTIDTLKSTMEYYKIKLLLDFYIEDLPIIGDESKFAQVLSNIINNAKDFLILNENENKWITIKTYKENNSAFITIEDNAGGIDEKVINKIFDIYFTTKHQSQGTGLGLYISYEIIKKFFKGKLYVENSEFGAKFIIELPIKV